MVCRFRFEQSIVPSCRSQVHTSGHTHGVEVARDATRAVMHAKDATTLAFFRSSSITVRSPWTTWENDCLRSPVISGALRRSRRNKSLCYVFAHA